MVKQIPAQPVWLTIQEAADRLAIKYATVSQWIREGRLPAVRYGRHLIRVEQADLDEFVRAHRTTP